MKSLGALLAGLFCASAHAATSDALFPIGGTNFPGLAGNVVFNGEHFVTPTVQSNGTVRLVFLNTNGFVVSNFSLTVTGSTPRVAFDGANYLLAWMNSNTTLHCARVTNNVVGSVSAVATNVAAETFSLRARAGNFLALWQSADSNSAVFARSLSTTGVPFADAFAVAPSVSLQRHPSMNREGTNCLVVWMEQNASSNDWRVLARFVNENGPVGSVVTVSEANSLRAWPTACSFGTNYLVAWSWDEYLQYRHDTQQSSTMTNGWFPMIHGRICSSSGVPQSNAFIIARFAHTNINPALAFADGNYLAVWKRVEGYDGVTSGSQHLQLLNSFGGRSQYPSAAWRDSVKAPGVTSGAKRFCVVYPLVSGITRSTIFGPQTIAEPVMTIRRTTNGTAASSSGASYLGQISTNLIEWTPVFLGQFTNWPVQGPLFVRTVDHGWPCVEQLRSIAWAKDQWRLDRAKVNTETPTDSDLYGPTRYLPAKPPCPSGGTYNGVGNVQTRPTCSVGLNHTI